MATITTILASDIIASSRVTLNTNFANLNTDKVDINSTYADPAWITSLAGSKITVASGQVLYGTGAGVAGSDSNFTYASQRVSFTTDAQLRFVAEGDSNTESGWPQNNLATYGYFRRARILNGAVSGSTSVTVLARFATTVTPYAKTTNAEQCYFALLIGTNDLRLLPADSAATIFGRISTIWSQAVAQGYNVIAMTIPPAVDITGGQETKRLALNVLIRAANTSYSYLNDVALQMPNSADTTYYDIDGIHFNNAGRARLSKYLAQIIMGAQNVGSLTVTGAIPFVSDFGTVAQNDGGEFVWNNTNKRLLAGGAAGAAGSVLTGNVSGFAGVWLAGNTAAPSILNYTLLDGGSGTVLNSVATTPLIFRMGNVDLARFAPTTGNLLLGTTTDDGTNRLQVAGNIIVNAGNSLRLQNAAANQFASMSLNASSIVTLNYPLSVGPSSALTSDVTLGVHNGTPTTGVTSVIVRAGAGQSTTDLTQFVTLSNGTSGVRSNGSIFGGTAVAIGAVGGSTNPFGVLLGSGADIRWSNAASFGGGTPDISLSRASANTLQVGDGGSNANGGLFASSIGVGVTPSIAANVNQVIIRGGSAQSTTNLTTWQNSGGTALAAIGADGGYRTNGGFFSALDSAGSQTRAVYGSSLSLANNRVAAWSSTTDATGTLDVSLSRAGVNIGQFGDGGSNSNGLLYLKGVRPVGSTVATLPTASGNTGMIATVTDATVTTIGTTVAGGGANTVLVWSNGTNWRIYAN
ncbi:MAG: GDSL-type esterase/lipase family protein [Acidobacteriota bacterium]|jgi:lysophospholipase L1-like esterase